MRTTAEKKQTLIAIEKLMNAAAKNTPTHGEPQDCNLEKSEAVAMYTEKILMDM